MTENEAAWVEVARLVLSGFYRKADASTVESIIIGIRSSEHPDCKAAVRQLNAGKVGAK